MEPIISPWIIYIIGLLHSLDGLLAILMVVDFIAAFALFAARPDYESEEDFLDDIKSIKKMAILFVIMGVIKLLIPTKEDMVTMLTLSYVTPDNIQFVKQDVVDFVQTVMDIVDKGHK